MTTPRLQTQSKLFYTVLADTMNFAYRELMDVTHLGLYAYENGFEIAASAASKPTMASSRAYARFQKGKKRSWLSQRVHLASTVKPLFICQVWGPTSGVATFR